MNALLAGSDVPQWALDAANAKTPAYSAEVPGVFLLNEQQVTVDSKGQRTLTTRKVYRAISREGRSNAVAAETYLTGTGKVKEVKAWLILPSGSTVKFGKEKVVDVSAVDNDVYGEVRVRMIRAVDEADPGTVFAWESVAEDRSIFSQFTFEFQERLPVLVSRLTLNLPAGWEVQGKFFNTEERKPVVAGNSFTWEIRDLPFIKHEDSSPAITGLAPRLGVTFFPNGDERRSVHAFASWSDVAAFQTEIAAGQDAVDDRIARTSKELVAKASTEFDRIAAIGHFVQGIHYIEISTNIGHGGGYRPHAAAAVIDKGYGDCKDKATLMRAMLKSVGIESRTVLIFSPDRSFTRPEWPSPEQFNHMIIAVSVAPETKASSVADIPKFGRILFFDPTDEVTPVGWLPEYEQDAFALMIASADGALVKIPKAPPDTNHLDRQTEITLNANGSASVKFTEQASGGTAAGMRRRYARATQPEYRKFVESWLTATVHAPVIGNVSVPDSPTAAKTERTVEFTSEQAGQVMQDRLLMFRPAMVGRTVHYNFSAPTRKYPVLLYSQSFSETVHVRVPDGFEVDEMPSPLKLELPYAKFQSDYALKDGVLTFHRTLEVQTATVPPEQYATVRDFFGRVLGAENAAVVLARK